MNSRQRQMKMGTFGRAQFLESEFGPKLPNCDNKMLIISSKQILHCKIAMTTLCLCRYTFSYLLCHALNLINVIVNINILNTFFDGRFTEFGTRLTWFRIYIMYVFIYTFSAGGWHLVKHTQFFLMYFPR